MNFHSFYNRVLKFLLSQSTWDPPIKPWTQNANASNSHWLSTLTSNTTTQDDAKPVKTYWIAKTIRSSTFSLLTTSNLIGEMVHFLLSKRFSFLIMLKFCWTKPVMSAKSRYVEFFYLFKWRTQIHQENLKSWNTWLNEKTILSTWF